MIRAVPWLLAGLAGGALGGFFFGGLWWTTQRLVTSRHPALLLGTSLLVRMAVVVSGLYVVADARWDRCLACMMGLVMVRTLMGRALQPLPRWVADAS